MPVEHHRREFPVTANCVFLNHAGVAPLSGRASDAIKRFLEESALGYAARYARWAKRVEDARSAAARLVGAAPDEIAFVKSTSHGLNHVAQGLDWQKGDNIVTYNKEFPSNVYPWMNLASRGVKLRMAGDREGRISPDDIVKTIDSNTRLLSISSVEFASGYRNDLEAIGRICAERGVLFCVDAIQSLGALKFDVKKVGVDFFAADAHKWLMGPEGVGIFYARRELLDRLEPVYVGWNSVENAMEFLPYHFDLKADASKFEEGSHNLPGIFALAGSMSLIEEFGVEKIEKRVIELTDYLVERLLENGWEVKSPRGEGEKSGIVVFSGNVVPVETVEELAAHKIYIAARQGNLRASPHFYNTHEEIDQLVDNLPEFSGSKTKL